MHMRSSCCQNPAELVSYISSLYPSPKRKVHEWQRLWDQLLLPTGQTVICAGSHFPQQGHDSKGNQKVLIEPELEEGSPFSRSWRTERHMPEEQVMCILTKALKVLLLAQVRGEEGRHHEHKKKISALMLRIVILSRRGRVEMYRILKSLLANPHYDISTEIPPTPCQPRERVPLTLLPRSVRTSQADLACCG